MDLRAYVEQEVPGFQLTDLQHSSFNRSFEFTESISMRGKAREE